jgi:glycosyltransferase 2 family protein
MLFRLAITVAILAYLSTRIDMGEAARATAAISTPHLVLVLMMVALDRAIMILRWVLLLRASGIGISTVDATRLFLVSSFVGSFLPAGIGADAARAYGLTRGTPHQAPGTRHQAPQATAAEALASVAVDRLLGVASLVLMAIIGLIAWTPQEPGGWRIPVAVGVALAACVAAFWANEWLRLLIPARRHEGFLPRHLLRLTDAVGRYRNRRHVLVHVLVWSVVVQVLRITQAYILGLGLGLTVPYSYYLMFMPLALLLLLLPISISGFGLPQSGIVWMLQPIGVPESQGFALSTLIVLTGLAGNLPGLFLWLRARNPVESRT